MTTIFIERVIFQATAAGTGSFIESSAVTGYQTVENGGGVDGQTFSYAAQTTDLSQWETGTGAWTASSKTLTRSPRFNSSAGTSAINFASAPQVMITALANDVQTGWQQTLGTPGYTNTIPIHAATGSSQTGPALNVSAGNGDGVGAGGAVNIQGGTAGTGGAASQGGYVNIQAGAGSSGIGAGGGSIRIIGGTAGNGAGSFAGGVTILGGAMGSSGIPGDIVIGGSTAISTDITVGGGSVTIYAGDGPGAGGAINVTAGSAVMHGGGADVGIDAGNGIGSFAGNIYLRGGNGDIGGEVALFAGVGSSGAGGAINIFAGDSNGGNGPGGDINFFTGAGNGSGRTGLIFLNLGSTNPGVSGALWNSAGTVKVSTG